MDDAGTTPDRRKIVVVEDDEETREIELFLLRAEGYEAVGLPDGMRAVETVAREAPGLVILDLMLPGKSGLTVLAELRADPRTAATPVVVVSAYLDNRSQRDVLRDHPSVAHVIRKPFDVTDLLDAVVRVVGPAA